MPYESHTNQYSTVLLLVLVLVSILVLVLVLVLALVLALALVLVVLLVLQICSGTRGGAPALQVQYSVKYIHITRQR